MVENVAHLQHIATRGCCCPTVRGTMLVFNVESELILNKLLIEKHENK